MRGAETTHAEGRPFLLGLWSRPFRVIEATADQRSRDGSAHDRLGLPQIMWLASCVAHGEQQDPVTSDRFGATKRLQKVRRLLT
jgi:hypothetical protein